MPFGDNLQKMRINRDITRKELAEKLNITEQMVGSLENNTRGKLPDWFYKLGEVLNCSYDSLVKGVQKHDSEIIYIKKCTDLEDVSCFSMYSNNLEEIGFSKIMLDNMKIKNYQKIRYMKYNNDNMYPTIKKHDDIFIDSEQREVVDNQIYAIQENNRIKVKRLFRKSPYDSQITVSSDNKDNKEYPDYEITPKQANELICGRVTYFGRTS